MAVGKGYYANRVKVPGTNVALLSVPSKMPGFSFSMTAGMSCPGAVYGKGAICSSCYAKTGRYVFANVKNALATRFDWVRKAMRAPESIDAFVTKMVACITDTVNATGETYFRIHDAGDFFSPAYVRAWIRIVDACPNVNFWAPTRSYRMAWLPVLQELANRPNVTLRPSALYFDEAPPVVAGLHAGSGAGDGFTCPASAQGNACGSCRACWTDKTVAIVYHRHGHEVRQ